jgi:hypothetical protein
VPLVHLAAILIVYLYVHCHILKNSAWDISDPDVAPPGTQTVNAVVLLEYDDTVSNSSSSSSSSVKLDATSEEHQWISADAAAAQRAGHDVYVVENLRRLAQHDAGVTLRY